MAKGRDTWDYLVYYLQLADADPPISELQLFRTPLTPIVLGLPMQLGGSALLEVVFGFLYAVTILAWSATALTFGRVPALFTARTPSRLPGVRHAVPPGVQRRRLRHRPCTLGAPARAHDAIAVGLALRRARRRHRRARPHPAGESGVPAARTRATAPASRLAPESRLVGRLPRSGGRAPRRLGAPQRRALRRRHRRTRRAGLGAVPHRVHRQPDDRPGERGSVPAACPPDRGARCWRRSRTQACAYRWTRTSRTVRTTRPSG